MIFVLIDFSTVGRFGMKEKTACFTGHRKIALGQREIVAERLKNTVESLISEGYRYFGAGGALGFDTLAAQCILYLKKQYPHIKLILVLPCETQTRDWKSEDVAIYERIKAQADKVVYTSKEYTRDCMFRRNRHLVDNSSICIAYLTKNKGGPAYTVDYAKKLGVTVINIADQN